jgi:hypothetical protein
MIPIQQLVAVVLFLVESMFKVFKSVGTMEELEAETQRVVQEASAKVLAAALERIDERLMREAKVPVLYGSNQDRPWVKYIIKDLVRAG